MNLNHIVAWWTWSSCTLSKLNYVNLLRSMVINEFWLIDWLIGSVCVIRFVCFIFFWHATCIYFFSHFTWIQLFPSCFDDVFQILAAAVVGVVVFLCIDQIGFIKGVLGTDLVVASAGLIIVAGCLLFIFSIFGLIAAALEHTTLLAIVSIKSFVV